jgi:hypothetical protein
MSRLPAEKLRPFHFHELRPGVNSLFWASINVNWLRHHPDLRIQAVVSSQNEALGLQLQVLFHCRGPEGSRCTFQLWTDAFPGLVDQPLLRLVFHHMQDAVVYISNS